MIRMSGTRTPEWVCWLDLETAGTDEHHDPILEVGAALCVNGPGMEIVSEFSQVVAPHAHKLATVRSGAPGVVREMHDANGLWVEVMAATCSIAEVDVQMAGWLAATTGRTDHIALAGSGVSHFDRRFIRAQMWDTDRRFTYWAYDVGVVRRLLLRVAPELVRSEPEGGKAHRALIDALDHRAEWLYYEDLLIQL